MIDLACTAFYLTATGSIALWIRHVAGESISKAVSCLQQWNEEAMQEVSVQRLIFPKQGRLFPAALPLQGPKQQVPTQLDPEVALTQRGASCCLQKPHVVVSGFDAPMLCVLSKLSSPT